MDPKEYRLAAIVYTDIVGFSKMMEEKEKATLELLKYHNEMIRKHTEALRGSIIKTLGDAFLIDFPNTVNAVNCAMRIQQSLGERNQEDVDIKLVLRIGVHLGDIYFYENDALGDGINIASRLQSICNPGRICISQDVFNLVNNKIDEISIREMGEVKLKNISRRINAYEILTDGSGKIEDAPDEESEDPPGSRSKPAFNEPALDGSALDGIQSTRGLAGDGQELKNAGMGEIKTPDPSEFPYNLRRTGRKFGDGGREAAREPEREFEPDGRRRRGYVYTVADSSGEQYLSVPDRRGEGSRDKLDKQLELAWDRVLNTPYDSSQDQQLVQEYRFQTNKSLRKLEAGLKRHLRSYFAVNGGLLVVGAIAADGAPWFLIPALAWGIGLVNHIAEVRRKRSEAKELQAFSALNKQQLKKLRKLNKSRGRFVGQVVGTLATSFLLAGINLIGPFDVPWALIPIAAMAIRIFLQLPAAKQKESELLLELSELGVPVQQLKGARRLKLAPHAESAHASLNPMEAEAENLKSAVLAQLAGMRDTSSLGEDFEQVLSDYVNQVKELSRKDQEINRTLEAIPMTKLERELLDLQKQHEDTGNPDIKIELEKSLDSIKKQQKSYFELQKQQQMLKIKLANAINSLRQLQFDLVRMKRTPEFQDLPPIDILRSRTGGINDYLSDLESEYRNLESRESELKT